MSKKDNSLHDIDVVIIGGGPAGLSAALSLGRARRRVIVVDAGKPRNAPAAHMHGVLGHDGLSPSRLLELGRDEIARYGVRIISETASAVRVRDAVIEVDTADGTIRTRRLLVATGLVDELANIPGMQQQWGNGVVMCPYCDGWEHRNDVIGVVATSPESVEQAQTMRQWSDRVIYFPNAIGEPPGEAADALALRGIQVELGIVTGLRIKEKRIVGVDVAGRLIPVGVVFTGTIPRPQDGLLHSLGATTKDGPLGPWVVIDDDGRTSVPGVWAVGNVVDVRANVSVCLGLGSLVAGAINKDLVIDDIARLRTQAKSRDKKEVAS
ncbi:NAD(P)/FAD-dependent oxidoreductase [Microbacterium sp. EST19A]|uniref:NAD(P)/FAD-dependent oxidoreductase n=1 Tax=Microbacterium sp. EST19A TaxID=2862681 RepID=UPI001CC10E61|nr:NAD(P)/FAD-dependent oxidoreductase [Microbacterium sp. EST19A]